MAMAMSLNMLCKLHRNLKVDQDILDLCGHCGAHINKVNGGVCLTWQGKTVWLHRLVLGFPDCDVDHIDRDRSNNLRSNLRLATHSQNLANSGPRSTNKSGYKGVSWDKRRNLWEASITRNGRKIYIGSYADKVFAARAYDGVAKQLFGEFAYQNFPEGD